MNDDQPLPPGDEDNQQPADAASAPVPPRRRRVRGYAATGADLSQVNAYLPPPAEAPGADETGSDSDKPQAAGSGTPGEGTA